LENNKSTLSKVSPYVEIEGASYHAWSDTLDHKIVEADTGLIVSNAKRERN